MHESDSFIQVDNARVRVRVLGEGPALVFVHGWALDLDMWTPQLAALSRDRRTIAFDRRGFGLSSGIPSIAGDVEDIRVLLQRLNVRKAALVGMSQGARVAARFAHAYPNLVSWLVLDGAPALSKAPAPVADIPFNGLRERARREGVQAVRREWLAHPFTKLHTQDPDVHALVRSIIERYPGTDLLTEPEATDHEIDSAQLTVPVLVINGEHDSPERLAAGEYIARVIRGAARSIVPNAGHLANLDNPIAYNTALCAFESKIAGNSRHRAMSEYLS